MGNIISKVGPSIFLSLVFVFSIPVSVANDQPQRFVPGELIVRFSANSPAWPIVAQENSIELGNNKALTDYLTDLSKEPKVPWVLKTATSGKELVLAVNQTLLSELLIEKLRTLPRVSSVGCVGISDRGTGSAKSREVVIEFDAGSQEQELLASAFAQRNDKPSGLTELTKRLSDQTGYPLGGRLASIKKMAVNIDLRALTLVLLADLKNHPHIRYVQLNFIATTFGF